MMRVMTIEDQLKQRLHDSTIPSHRSWLGKRVSVTDDYGDEWVGNLTYLGASVNKDVLQATVNKTPVFPIQLKNVKLL